MADYSSLSSMQFIPSIDDCNFVEEVPDHLSCSICLGVINDPHLLSCCGIKYCGSCINPIESQSKPCPNCRDPDFNTMLDKEMQRTVLNLKVYCDHKAEGCPWVGEVRYLQGHLDNKCLHVGVACKYCSHKYSKQLIDKHESEGCPLLPMEVKIMNELRSINSKVKELESECQYWKGQSAVLKEELNEQKKSYKESTEKIMAEVEEDRSKYQQEMKELRETVESMKQKSNEMYEKTIQSVEVFDECIPWAKKCQTYSENLSRSFRDWDIPKWQSPPPIVFSSSTPPCQFIMSDFSKYRDSGELWYSPPFYSWPGGYKLYLKVLANGDMGKYVSVGVVSIKGEFDHSLTWPIQCIAKVKMLNMLRNSNHISHDITVESPSPIPLSPSSKRRSIPEPLKSTRWFESFSSTRLSPDIIKKQSNSLKPSSPSDKTASLEASRSIGTDPSISSTMVARFVSHASLSENPIIGSKYCGARNCICFRVEQCLNTGDDK